MRFLYWVCLCLCGALGVVPALGNVNIENGAPCTITVYYAGSGTLVGSAASGGTANCTFFAGVGYDIRDNYNSKTYYTTAVLPNGSSWVYSLADCDCVQPPACGSFATNAPAASTNGYAWKCVEWVNNGTKYADFMWTMRGTNGVDYVLGNSARAVPPGKGVNICMTNWGQGGEFCWGDARADTGMDEPEECGYGQWVSVGNGVGPGGGPTEGNYNPTNPPYQPPFVGNGSTNGLTAQDYFAGVGTLNKAIAGVEDAIRGGVGGTGGGIDGTDEAVVEAVEANTLSTAGGLTNIAGLIGTGTNGLSGGLMDISDRIGNDTNGLAGLIGRGTNGIAGLLGTNGLAGLLGRSSNTNNTNGLAGIMEGLFRGFDTNLIGAIRTNAYGVGTNAFGTGTNLSGAISNSIAEWIPEVVGIQNFADGATEGVMNGGGLLGLNGSAPAAGWGVLRGYGYGGVTIFELDAKKSLSLGYIEEKVTGVRAWLRVITMWAALFFVVSWYLRDLREAVWHVLTPVPLNSPTEALQVIGGLAVGPAGFAAGTAAGYLMKTASIVAILLGLIWLPSILAVSLGTIFAALGLDVVGDLSNAVGAPEVVSNVVQVMTPWLPAAELCIIALNMAVARLGMDGTVSILMVYIKVGTPE